MGDAYLSILRANLWGVVLPLGTGFAPYIDYRLFVVHQTGRILVPCCLLPLDPVLCPGTDLLRPLILAFVGSSCPLVVGSSGGWAFACALAPTYASTWSPSTLILVRTIMPLPLVRKTCAFNEGGIANGIEDVNQV